MPIGHREAAARAATCSARTPSSRRARSPNDALGALKPLLEDPGVLKVGQNLKFDWLMFARRGIDVHPYDDTMLMSYVLDAGKGEPRHGRCCAEKWLGHQTIPLEARDRHRQGRR